MVSPVVHSEEDNSELQGFCSEKGRQSWRLRLQMLFSSPCQVCPGDRLPKYLGHLHLPHMGVERSDLPVGEHTLLELRLCMGTKMFLNLRCSGVARAWYQAGEPIQMGSQPQKMLSQMWKAKRKTLHQVVKRKYLQETLCEYLFMVWNVFTLAVFVPPFYSF